MLGGRPQLAESDEGVAGPSVYDGRKRIGYLVKHRQQWLASADDDQVIGTYPTENAAVEAVVANALGERRK
jgi:hypothetical protein